MQLNFKFLTLIFLGMIIALGYLGGWWDMIGTELTSVDVAPEKQSTPVPPAIVIDSPILTGWDDCKKSWEIEASKIWQTSNGSQFHFENIRNGVIYSVKDKRVEFLAGWARLERNRSELFLGGGLEAKIDEAIVKTSEGMMNYKQEEVFCPKEVVYQENDTMIKAQKMTIHLKKDEFLLEGDVQFIEKKDQMKADGLLYNSKEKKYYLIGPREIILYP